MAGFNAFLKNNNIITGTAIPTEGNFKTGDIIVNVGPNSAAEPMWICNEGGNPGVWGPVGVSGGSGSGSIVSINSSVIIDEPTNEIPLDSLGVIVTKKDKLLVHYNSIHLLEGVHFEIAGNGTKIVKLGEGSWNEEGLEDCMFAFELFKGVQNIDGNEITVASKMTCKTNHVIIENPCGEVEIGIEGFKSENDMMLVFKNGVNMVEGVDYEVQGGKIVSTGEVWNENGIEDYGMTFVVLKEVVEYNGDAEVKAENIADGSIGMDKLGEDVKEAIEDVSNIDLSGKQDKSDEGLVTTDKTIVGAINELFQDVDSGKNIIADAIDVAGITGDSTFAAMGEAIEGKNTEIFNLQTELAGKVTPAGNATADQVLQGSTFMNSSGQVVTGTMANMSTHTQVTDYIAWNENRIYLGIPTGAYVNVPDTGYPEVYIEKTRLDSNLVPENIVSGKSICGVAGSAIKAPNVTAGSSYYLLRGVYVSGQHSVDYYGGYIKNGKIYSNQNYIWFRMYFPFSGTISIDYIYYFTDWYNQIKVYNKAGTLVNQTPNEQVWNANTRLSHNLQVEAGGRIDICGYGLDYGTNGADTSTPDSNYLQDLNVKFSLS